MKWTKEWPEYKGKVCIVQKDNVVVYGQASTTDVQSVRLGVIRDDNGKLEWHHPAYVFPIFHMED
jgi:hypothetical protein